MKRRNFVTQGLGAAAALTFPLINAGAAPSFTPPSPTPPQTPPPAGTAKPRRFKLRYAPSFGQFKAHAGDDLTAQIKFASDEGFTAMFDNGLMSRPADQQETISRELAKRNMLLGPFVLWAEFGKTTLVTKDKDVREAMLQKMKQGVETMNRTGCKQALLVPGRYHESLDWEYQTANVIENLRLCDEICRPAGMVLVLEPLNPKNHPGLFLSKIPQAYEICKAVNSPSCKIINDMYHQQITEGNIIPNIEAAWDEIAAFHIGDNPGRKEPTTGEINYRNVFKRIFDKGFQGALGMEHGQSRPGKDGERAVIDAYRACDAF
jgi:hydroxypyruvate isomerase